MRLVDTWSLIALLGVTACPQTPHPDVAKPVTPSLSPSEKTTAAPEASAPASPDAHAPVLAGLDPQMAAALTSAGVDPRETIDSVHFMGAAQRLLGVSATPEAEASDNSWSSPAAMKQPLKALAQQIKAESNTWVRHRLASQLVAAYKQNPVAADRDFKGRIVEAYGIVNSIGRDGDGTIVVGLRAGATDSGLALRSAARHTALLYNLSKDMPGSESTREALRVESQDLKSRGDEDFHVVPCRFAPASAGAVADIEVGQLVSIQGGLKAPSSDSEGPSLVDASLAWAGDRPGGLRSESAMRTNALIAARSVDACCARLNRVTVAINAVTAPDPKAQVDKAALDHAVENADVTLTKLGSRLPCLHPLVLLTLLCDDFRLYEAEVAAGGHLKHSLLGQLHKDGKPLEYPECTEQVKNAVAALNEKPKDASKTPAKHR